MAQIAEARARQINFSSFVIDEWFLGVGLASSAVFLFRGDAVATHLSTPSGHALLFGWLFATSFGCCLSVVRHADHLAIRLGEPYGTLIPLGSVLSTIGLTIPVMICIGQLQGSKLVLGLQSGNAAMLVLTLVVNLVTFASGRTNIYRERVATLQDTLSAAGGTSGAASALRALMEKIVLAPALDAPDGLHVELHGALAPILTLAAGGPATRRMACTGAGAEPGTSVPGGLLSVVAGTRNPLCRTLMVWPTHRRQKFCGRRIAPGLGQAPVL